MKNFEVKCVSFAQAKLKAIIAIAIIATLGSCVINVPEEPNTSLDGTWEMVGWRVDINGSTGTLRRFQTTDAAWNSAFNLGYINIGDQLFRSISKTGDLSWRGQVRYVNYNTNRPTVATGVSWIDITISMKSNGKSFDYFDSAGKNIGTWDRQ